MKNVADIIAAVVKIILYGALILILLPCVIAPIVVAWRSGWTGKIIAVIASILGVLYLIGRMMGDDKESA